MTFYYEIRDADGTVLGYTYYQTTAGVWSSGTADSIEDAQAWRNVRTCLCRTGRDVELVRAFSGAGYDERDIFEQMYCDTHRALVPLPFDGYSQHEYGCTCGNCD